MASRTRYRRRHLKKRSAQLEAIVTSIEQGKIGLQESIAQYEKGMRLLQYCRSVLTDAEAKIQQLQLGADGNCSPSPSTRLLPKGSFPALLSRLFDFSIFRLFP